MPARKLRDLTVGDRHKLTAEVLRLVYGNTDATRASIARFSVTCVARHLHLSPLLIKSVLRAHFYRQDHPVVRRRTNHDPFRLAAAITSESLRAQTTLALVDRAAAYEAANPGERLSRQDYGRAQRMLGCRKKAIVKKRQNPRKYTPELMAELTEYL